MKIPSRCGSVLGENQQDWTERTAKQRLSNRAAFETNLYKAMEQLTRLFIVAQRNRVKIVTTKMSVDSLLEDADVEFPVPTDERIALYRHQLQQQCDNQNDWLQVDEALDHELAIAFQPKEGSISLSDQTTHHYCGKHLLGCMLRHVSHALNVELKNLGATKLYVRLITHISLQPLHAMADTLVNRYGGIFK
jgi:hypothetical protein